ncbi:MAG: TatD-related deoxyribonuclease [Acidimicrobiia bacterium]|nr:MAG: TatD-related deoxyribonuclease [Acidimicrobiia bacterium]
MGWVDTHCHLQLDRRPPETLLEGVDWVVVPGIDAESSEAAIALADAFPDRVVAACGVHPHNADRWGEEQDRIASLAVRAAAVGETGLDYYRDLAPRSMQRSAFAAHIRLALDLDKPLVVHCRDAFADVHRMLEETAAGPRTVMHCWTGGRKWTRRFLDLGVTFSFAGPLTYPNARDLRRAAEIVPPDRVVVETDTPYLTPQPHRGEPNRPAWVGLVGEELARIWGAEPEEVARLTSSKAEQIFGGPRR